MFDEAGLDHAKRKVFGPAIALIIVSSISIALLTLALAFDVWLLANEGSMAEKDQSDAGWRTKVLIRTIWDF